MITATDCGEMTLGKGKSTIGNILGENRVATKTSAAAK